MIMVGFLAGFLGLRIRTIYATNEYSYEKLDLYYTDEEMNQLNYTLGRFNDSLNFAFGFLIWDETFDVLNNPYFEFKAWQIKVDETTDNWFRSEEIYEV